MFANSGFRVRNSQNNKLFLEMYFNNIILYNKELRRVIIFATRDGRSSYL